MAESFCGATLDPIIILKEKNPSWLLGGRWVCGQLSTCPKVFESNFHPRTVPVPGHNIKKMAEPFNGADSVFGKKSKWAMGWYVGDDFLFSTLALGPLEAYSEKITKSAQLWALKMALFYGIQ